MDERVEKAMQQWPNVPEVFGWLQLNRRGQWLLRGESISNPKLIEFINRNIIRTEEGSYAFQNGPQRVHIELEATPWIVRVNDSTAEMQLQNQFGDDLQDIDMAYLDPDGQLIFRLSAGPGLLHDNDLGLVLPYITDPHQQPMTDEALLAWLGNDQSPPLRLALPQIELQIAHAPEESLWPEFFQFKKAKSPVKDS